MKASQLKPEDVETKVAAFNLYKEHHEAIERVSKERRYFNRSQALRDIIDEWIAAQNGKEEPTQ